MTAGLKWILAVLAFVAVATGSTMYSAAQFDEAQSARTEVAASDKITVDSIYSDRIEGQYDPDYDRGQYQKIAGSFDTDPLYVDEYQAFEVQESDLEAIRAEISDLDVPIYVAIVTTSDLDAADGEGNLIAGRIAAELSDDRATVLVVDNIGEAISGTGAIRRLNSRPEFDPSASESAVALDYVRALKTAEIEDPDVSYSPNFDRGDPIVVAEDTSRDPRELAYPASGAAGGIALGLIVGGGLGISGVLTLRYIRKRRGAETRER